MSGDTQEVTLLSRPTVNEEIGRRSNRVNNLQMLLAEREEKLENATLKVRRASDTLWEYNTCVEIERKRIDEIKRHCAAELVRIQEEREKCRAERMKAETFIECSLIKERLNQLEDDEIDVEVARDEAGESKRRLEQFIHITKQLRYLHRTRAEKVRCIEENIAKLKNLIDQELMTFNRLLLQRSYGERNTDSNPNVSKSRNTWRCERVHMHWKRHFR
mmetsp:Transcript_28102/g.59450  ORF Transcript_28102/g.59450 Transcript_28102/m.59450 type:complete len:218 (-) Transcript_28102:8-661(-)